MATPFYLVCGYGDTGKALVAGFQRYGMQCAVIDGRQSTINMLLLENYPLFVPSLCADAERSEYLVAGGVQHPCCAGVIAITNQNQVNLQIAITCKLLNPGLPVLCRADSHTVEANMASFGTDHIVDPFDTFGEHLATCLHSPSHYLLHEWLTGLAHAPLIDAIHPPRGLWVVCGYGQFGKAIYKSLEKEGIPAMIIEPNPERTAAPAGSVKGLGSEAAVLREAKIDQAVGVVAGTDDDADNLSMIVTARELNPKLFVVARQNRLHNQAIFDAAHADIVMQPSEVIANKIRGLLAAPLLEEFLSLGLAHDDRWAEVLVERLAPILHGRVPDVWRIKIGEVDANAVHDALRRGKVVRLRHLLRNPRHRAEKLPCMALLMVRDGERIMLPEESTSMQPDDRILFCGAVPAWNRIQWTLQNPAVLTYVVTGQTPPLTPASRWLGKVFGQPQKEW